MPYSVEKSIKAKGLTQDNYLQHLDEMTDEEITYMLDMDPQYSKEAQETRQALQTTPKEEWSRRGLVSVSTDRKLAEYINDLGI